LSKHLPNKRFNLGDSIGEVSKGVLRNGHTMDACFGSGNGYVHSLDIDVELTVNVVEIKGNGLFFGGGASNNPEFEDGVHVTG